MNWKPSDIKKLTGYKPKPHSRAVKIPKTEAKGLMYIKNWLKLEGVNCETEYKFNPDRKWRFDIVIPSYGLAIEYEGIYSKTSRHTSLKGYSNDAEKYNSAQILGWKVLRYTAKNYKDFTRDFKLIKP